MSRTQRISILIVLPLLGAIFACLLIFLIPQINTRSVKWQSLGTPPEKAIKILAITDTDELWIQADAGKVYKYIFTANSSCENNGCWIASDNIAIPASREFLPLDMCGSYMPTLPKQIDSKAVCDRWGIGGYLRVYAINTDGSVFAWEHGIGGDDGIQLLTWPCAGAILAFLIAFMIVSRSPDTAAQHGVHLTGGYAPRFRQFSWLKPVPLKWVISSLPPASNANRWAFGKTRNSTRD